MSSWCDCCLVSGMSAVDWFVYFPFIETRKHVTLNLYTRHRCYWQQVQDMYCIVLDFMVRSLVGMANGCICSRIMKRFFSFIVRVHVQKLYVCVCVAVPKYICVCMCVYVCAPIISTTPGYLYAAPTILDNIHN